MFAEIALWIVAVISAAGPVPERMDLTSGYYLLAKPADFDPTVRYPLIVCLHGTETRGQDILEFWLSLEAELPFILVAPQGIAQGWRDADLAFLEEFRSHISQTLRFDTHRVLLTGHSAGGAMAFHLFYAENFEASAVAVTANYVPPTVKHSMVQKRKDTPLFYAVGEADLNRPRMRKGLYLLRGAGVNVAVKRPPIGHVLSPEIGQAALGWFEGVCRKQVASELKAADVATDKLPHLGAAAAQMEHLLRNQKGHFPDQIAMAADLLHRLQQPGRRAFAQAEQAMQNDEPMEARRLLLETERRYHGSSLETEATARREEVDRLPQVAQTLASQRAIRREKEAEVLYEASLEALSQSNLTSAARYCRSLLDLYPDSRSAPDARHLLNEIKTATGTQQP